MVGNRKGLLALSPLMVFVVLYLVVSVLAGDFYAVPICVAFLVASIYAMAVFRGLPLGERIATFSRGAGQESVMMVQWIYLLAGAFASSAKHIGCIDSTVNLLLDVLPGGMVLPGIFIASCIVSLSIGTSVGTIVALAPIAAGMAGGTGLGVPLMAAAVVCGAFFGDNLSFISDTTIVVTTSQGCAMSDKFRANSWIAMPAAVAAAMLYAALGVGASSPVEALEVEPLKVVPYVAVLVLAFMGVNVMAVLSIGIALVGIIGLATGSFGLYGWFQSMGEGVLGMGELVIITLLAGGLFELVRSQGGIDYIIERITRRIGGKRGGEYVLAMLAGSVVCCTANNTVALITVGSIAKRISDHFGIDPRRAASVLDTASCVVLGMLPYGGQILLATSLAGLNPTDVVPYLYYQFLLGAFLVVGIMARFPRKYC